MFHFFNQIPDFNSVTAGKRASVRIPNGPTYREFVLKFENNGAKAPEADFISEVEEIVLKINGTTRYEISGKDLLMLNKYLGFGFNAGELVIPLTRPNMRTMEAEENLCWGTANVDNIFLEVKLAGTAVNPVLSVDAWVTPQRRDLGAIIEVHSQIFSTATVGKKEIPDLAKDNGSLVSLHLDNANITDLEVKINKVPFIENDTDLTAYQNSLARIGGRTPQAGIIHVDPWVLNRIDDSWPLEGLQTFNVNPVLSAAGDVPIIMETLNLPLGEARPLSQIQ